MFALSILRKELESKITLLRFLISKRGLDKVINLYLETLIK